MKNYTAPWVRIAILVVGIIGLSLLSKYYTGSILPDDPKQAIVFQNALLLLVLGTSLLESYFTKPADSVVNSLMGIVTLLTVHGSAPRFAWNLVFAYCLLVFIMSMICVSVSSKSNIGWRKTLSNFTYRPSIIFGRARLLFTIVFLSGLYFFYDVQDDVTLALILFWGLFLSIWPLKLPELITSWIAKKIPVGREEGTIARVDNPGIVRVSASALFDWNTENPKICVLPNGDKYWLQPLYAQFQESGLYATGILTNMPAYNFNGAASKVMEPSIRNEVPTHREMMQALGGREESVMSGFVVERSDVGTLKFELLDPTYCYSGMLVWAKVNSGTSYYQVLDGQTCEETFNGDKHGHHVATAVNLGMLIPEQGFVKTEWIPLMNVPVFTAASSSPVDFKCVKEGEFVIGQIPHSKIDIGGDFLEDYNYHTAILGVTGSGKTELAFDLIRHSISNDMKVICIDLTAQYEKRLADCSPVDLSLSGALAAELSTKLFEVETGSYGAGAEKMALEEFAIRIRDEVEHKVSEFLINNAETNLALIQLTEISNTKATLWITEMYMSCLLKYARDNPIDCPKTLIVVEEAHTVMPEPSSMGLGDYDSRGLVGKISQIALQGRKYGVGLLVLAQRTANVSKTVLTQCNTIISFACYDETSLGFLKNIYSEQHISLIPNLPVRQAVCFGKWIRTERPVVVKLPYDEKKARFS